MAGFVQNDHAMLATVSHLLLYPAAAVASARATPATSKAQQALRNGCSDPERLKPPRARKSIIRSQNIT